MEDVEGLPAMDDTSVFASDLRVTNGPIPLGTSVAEGDDQSSSLSDIDDGPDEDEADDNDPSLGEVLAQDDSEAETERLENSPLKLAKYKNVVLSSTLRQPEPISAGLMQRSTEELSKDEEGSDPVQSVAHEDMFYTGISNGDTESTAAGTLSVLLEEPCDGNKRVPSPPEIAGKKRKRTSPRSQEAYDENEDAEMARKRSSMIKSEPNGNSLSNQNSLSEQDIEERRKELEATASEIDAEQANDDENIVKDVGHRSSSTKAKKGKTGKRKGKKVREVILGDTATDKSMPVNDTYTVDDGQVPDVDNEEEEDTALVEGDGEEAEADIAARTEEESHAPVGDDADGDTIVMKKKTAMDSLSAIEKHFAAFRDKLYDERVAQLTNELAQLTQPTPNYPEYLAMLQCLDQRRDEKIHLEQVLLEYKIKALEIKSVAERSQLHSQYYQTVRAIRERKLEEVGEQWYQIQRDRRGCEGSGNVSDFTYNFAPRRSQQITQQTAYNLEVSILSGVAKYVGFPAAPSINGARSSEIDDDFQNMGIKIQLRPTVNNEQSLPLHAALSAVPPSRRKPSADEQFLEQNAWANPQHPAHQHLQQLAQQQQAAHQSQISNSLITPVTQRRTTDRSALKGSASTIPDENSVLSSSAAATPLSITQSQNRQPSGKGVITEPFPSLTHTKSNLFSYNALALAEGDRSPTDTRRRVQDHEVLGRPPVAQEPGVVQQGTAPASRSIFSAVLNKQSAASHPGLFTEHLGLNPSPSPSSAVKSNEVPDNPHSSPPVSHLQHLQGSSITAGTGLGRFASR